jgi:dihydroxyacetone kinase-like protein
MSDTLGADGIVDAVRRIDAQIDSIRDELNAADRVLGDGDTGMTIANVVAAWQRGLASPHADVGTLLLELGRETRRATGSSLGSVLAIGIIAAGRNAPAQGTVDRAALVGMLDASASAIAERSGATAGDKTILDSLIAVRTALADAAPAMNLGSVATEGAARALTEFRSCEARVGRARVYGEKSIGHDDPGMLAALLLLRAATQS